MEMTTSAMKRKKVLCPVSGKDGKTFWLRMGAAYENRDGSWNLYLDALPVNGRLQIRDWDDAPSERERRPSEPREDRAANLPF